MTTSRTTRRSPALVVVFALLALVACGDDDGGTTSQTTDPTDGATPEELVVGPGVDEDAKTITVVALSALTGPGEAIGVPGTAGQRAYFEGLNDAGGIDGWTIELIEADSQYNPQLHKQLYEEHRDEVAMVSQSVGSPTTAAIVDDVIADGMTILPASAALALCRVPNMIPLGTPYQVDVINGFQWLVDERDAPEGAPAAIVYQDDEYGQDALAGYQRAVEEFGFESVGELTYARTDTDFTSVVRTLQDSGADYVQLAATPAQTGPIIATAAQSGYEPTWILSGPSWDEALLTRAGLPAALFANTFLVTPIAPWGEEGIAGMAEMIEGAETYAPGQEPSSFFLVGWVQAKMAEQVLRNAIESGDLSREGIAAAATDLSAVDLEGLLPEASITAEDRVPSRESSVFAVDPDAPSSIRRIADLFTSPVAEDVTCS